MQVWLPILEYTRRLVCWPDVLAASDSDSYKVWALIEFAWWCCAPEGNLANTIARMFEAVQYFHRLRMEWAYRSQLPWLSVRSEVLQGPT